MSRKHNCKHPNRGLSNYLLRLRKRGFHKTPTMESLADLKRRQDIKPPVWLGDSWEFDEKEVRHGSDQVQELPRGNRAATKWHVD